MGQKYKPGQIWYCEKSDCRLEIQIKSACGCAQECELICSCCDEPLRLKAQAGEGAEKPCCQ